MLPWELLFIITPLSPRKVPFPSGFLGHWDGILASSNARKLEKRIQKNICPNHFPDFNSGNFFYENNIIYYAKSDQLLKNGGNRCGFSLVSVFDGRFCQSFFIIHWVFMYNGSLSHSLFISWCYLLQNNWEIALPPKLTMLSEWPTVR